MYCIKLNTTTTNIVITILTLFLFSRVKNISIWAFRECTNLSITIPETVESITDPYRENPFLNVKLVRLPSKFKSVITGAIRTEYY